MIILLLVILISLILTAYFAGIETGFISINKIKLKHLIERHYKNAHILEEYNNKKDKFLSLTLLGTNLFVVTATSLSTYLAIKYIGPKYGSIIEYVVITPIILIFCEIIPKTMFYNYSLYLTLHTIRLIRFFEILLLPILFVVNIILKVLSLIIPLNDKKQNIFMTRHDLEVLLEKHTDETILSKIERDMIDELFDFRQTTVKEVMIPLVDIVAIKLDDDITNIKALALKYGYSRIMTYKKRVDKLSGFIHIHDLFYKNENIKILKEIERKTIYVPETLLADRLLIRMLKLKLPVAIVIDEYGGTAGIVSLEDLIEEVVGEIQDEFDINEEAELIKSDKNKYILDGIIDIDDLNDNFNLQIPKEDGYETLAGYILKRLGRLPIQGEEIEFEKYQLKVIKVVDQTIERVELVINE